MVSSRRLLYFAYGSNMFTRRLRDRAPSARPFGIARLPGHRLAWHKIGRDGSAKCDIRETGRPDDFVWGILFEIASAEKSVLDRAEGLGCGYEYKTVSLFAQGLAIEAGTYYATHIDVSLRPFDWYLSFVLAGAREHGLPSTYLSALTSISAVNDPDVDRRKRNLALLQGA
ncbi:hypothetical protein KR51_00029750 [Rubidibacter lacunae KORDI 51-2]|uniref:AIG2-like family n=1 Tax=Rubidibacter lacunae KORDI 51-2 TaxID=582515 RepID=U5DIL4_9CHRO|nr:gamma-glutamylcyclotransferase family protein [Rubidibacter lacunae]ERN40434.1 hypothetical protein KR51_00029750 [Rubidibacter lacunae KORDI 51-2]